jgi:flagellar operon protein
MAIDVLNRFPSVPQISGVSSKENSIKREASESSIRSFESIFREKQKENEGLKISKHANERIISRNINLTDDQWERLNTGVKKAEMKGIKESLVMVDDFAFIVNVDKNTLITAVDENEDRVFTNIDGAVIV